MTRKAVSVKRPASELQGKVFDVGVMLGSGSHDGLARLGRVGCLQTLLPRRSHPEMLDVANAEDGADFLSSLVSWGWRRQGLQLRDSRFPHSPFPIPHSLFLVPHSSYIIPDCPGRRDGHRECVRQDAPRHAPPVCDVRHARPLLQRAPGSLTTCDSLTTIS